RARPLGPCGRGPVVPTDPPPNADPACGLRPALLPLPHSPRLPAAHRSRSRRNRMRVALLSANAQAGDAIGNNVAHKLRFFRDAGARVRVLVESDRRLHPDVAPFCQVMPVAEPRGDGWRFLRSADLLSVEFGHYYPLLSLLPLLADGKPRVLVDYHGITPPDLWGAHNREPLVEGLQMRGLAWCADATITHSIYTQDELHTVTGLPRSRLPRLGFPVDRGLFSPGLPAHGPPAHDWRRALGLDEA